VVLHPWNLLEIFPLELARVTKKAVHWEGLSRGIPLQNCLGEVTGKLLSAATVGTWYRKKPLALQKLSTTRKQNPSLPALSLLCPLMTKLQQRKS
jgi:hypothetical protein